MSSTTTTTATSQFSSHAQPPLSAALRRSLSASSQTPPSVAGHTAVAPLRDASSSTETPRLSPFSSGLPAKGKLFAHQQALPPLPVPSLTSTLPLLLRSVQATVDASAGKFTATDLSRVNALAADFKSASVGEPLQARLLSHAKKATGSWLEQWWNDWAYMSSRDPLVFNVNYFFHFSDPKSESKNIQISRAALIAKSAYLFFLRLQKHDLDPETAKSGPLCSHQYNYMFNTCRVPRPGSDVSHFYCPDTNHHVAVACKKRFYSFSLRDNATKAPLSIAEIEQCLAAIKRDATSAAPLGALTTQNRDAWASSRSQLLEGADGRVNLAPLTRLESSLFLLCLDDESPETLDDCARLFWHGDGRNRFFDKSLQFIIAANGKAGFNGEHSLMDATPTGRLCEFVVASSAAPNAAAALDSQVENIAAPISKSGNRRQLNVERLDFSLSDATKDNIKRAEAEFDKLRDSHNVNVMAFRDFGKNELKRLGISPDAFVQISFQLAYARLHGGHIATTYETSQTRQFSHGRTEAGRSVTIESVAFVQAVLEQKADAETCAARLRAAASAHGQYMKAAGSGKAIDRHLLGLRLILNKGERVPELLDDPLVVASKYWQMSTSQLTSEYFDGYGWGQVVPDGYGLPYMIKNNSIHVNVASLGLDSAKLNREIARALIDMRKILASSPASSSKSRL